MSRVVFLMDKIMEFRFIRKSVVPLISGTACAIPAIMATRNIENWKERLITILVTLLQPAQIARLCNYYRVSDSGYVCLGILIFKD
jgi:Fe2+ transport system protein B